MNFTDEQIQAAWEKAQQVDGYDPKRFRKAVCCNSMKVKPILHIISTKLKSLQDSKKVHISVWEGWMLPTKEKLMLICISDSKNMAK